VNSFLNPPFIISILIALSVHEWAHGFMADKLGDPTAKYEGRLTLNPIAHLDPMGTLLFLLIGFGWGKPVPIDPRYFKKPKRDMALTAIAGPVSNLILAFVAFGGLLLIAPSEVGASPMALLGAGHNDSVFTTFLIQVFSSSLFLNLGLMAFNLLPVAPLDGSKVIGPFIPLRYEDRYHEFMRRGPFILLMLLIAERLLNIPLLFGWIYGIMTPVLSLMNWIAGLF